MISDYDQIIVAFARMIENSLCRGSSGYRFYFCRHVERMYGRKSAVKMVAWGSLALAVLIPRRISMR